MCLQKPHSSSALTPVELQTYFSFFQHSIPRGLCCRALVFLSQRSNQCDTRDGCCDITSAQTYQDVNKPCFSMIHAGGQQGASTLLSRVLETRSGPGFNGAVERKHTKLTFAPRSSQPTVGTRKDVTGKRRWPV